MAIDHPTGGATLRTLSGGKSDRMIAEAPLALVVGASRLITIRTPLGREDDEAWARGFLVGEGVVDGAHGAVSIRHDVGDDGIPEVHAELPGEAGGGLDRAHEIRPSCGLCGSLGGEGLTVDGPTLVAGRPRVSVAQVAAMARDMRRAQPLFEATGACHAVALFRASGQRVALGEDVGRHNAVDKALGKVLMAGGAAELGQLVALLSGRAGFELVAKLLRAGVPVIASISAPSALAFDLCKEAGATLLGFVRGEDARVYWDAGRIDVSSGGSDTPG